MGKTTDENLGVNFIPHKGMTDFQKLGVYLNFLVDILEGGRRSYVNRNGYKRPLTIADTRKRKHRDDKSPRP